MADRLKDIWGGFASQTERRLTGKGVDNIVVPHRADYEGADAQFLPENFESPAERAFTALRADLAAKEKKAARRKGKKSAAAPDEAPRGGSHYAPEDIDEKKWGSDDLNRGLWSTAMRVERSDLDYGRYLSSDAGKKALKRTKKKRFGLF